MSSFSIYLLTLALLLQTNYGASSYLNHVCSGFENFTTNDPYESNLRKLMGNLYYQTPPVGFGLGLVGHYPYQTYGLALCRGGVEATDCRTCVNQASAEIHKRCPYNKGAIIWYDNCLLKYLNTDFLGQIDNQNKFYLLKLRNVSEPTSFNQKTSELLSLLAKEASATPKLYADGELELGESRKLYGLAQCTWDLSSSDCFECLDGIIGELPRCCDGKEGGRVVGGSCNIRYEIYPFVSTA
ncbi:cysteine-rich repeat secretory protein 38-like [Alnus glutinosa]|uniref:cysteine-rich repeat secretory protein 38-like n=1 Tax=Alnus glutinosa TaxID=3517 RepID=UPI002D79DEA5|nr:cysteine-rich repeat secretory protein 38-like [Alnus glutinosa]